MSRELPRTIRSLSPALQRGISEADYEILVVDNGSSRPPSAEDVRQWSPNARLIVVPDPTVSPVPAINLALDEARGEVVGVLIDGARMASPGLLAAALEASRIHPRAIVGSLAFHLGPDVQMRSVQAGYDQQVEDRLLEAINWEEDPYRLYDISVFAGSSSQGWFTTPAETNALFLSRSHWSELGGYDPRFVAPGGGLANLDIWERLCADPEGRLVLLMGEATFHQVHGGVATNSRESPWDMFHTEYVAIRGKNYEAPQVEPLVIGRLHPAARPSIRESFAKLMGEASGPSLDPVALPVYGPDGPRTFETAIPGAVLDRMQDGVMQTVYRDVRFLKSPLDIGLYLQLLSQLRPRTVIEIGCRFGGSALWFADMMSAHGTEAPRVISVDIDPQVGFSDPRISILTGDAAELGGCLTDVLLASCPRPWLVVEDSSHHYHHALAVLEFFHPKLEPGDYIVVEDGVVNHMGGDHYRQYENGPNRAVSDFLVRETNSYQLDTRLSDFYGRNATYNPNGWLRRL
ncbi:class I SAM-dependent methyltransferase [Sphingobium sufflavum]|nr:class I SAM-dependent methyltransferase [Sphingobium sufflavum]